jgi:hypothetical protein
MATGLITAGRTPKSFEIVITDPAPPGRLKMMVFEADWSGVGPLPLGPGVANFSGGVQAAMTQ